MARTACPSCRTEAVTRSARWCSWCGATLSGTPAEVPGARHRRGARRPPIGAVVTVLAVFVVVTAGLVLAAMLTVGVTQTERGYPANGPPARGSMRGAGQVELEPDRGLDELLADGRAVEPGSAAVDLDIGQLGAAGDRAGTLPRPGNARVITSAGPTVPEVDR